MPRRGYQLELQNLRDQTVLLGTIVDEALQRAIESLYAQDRALAQSVVDEDRIVNRKRYRIEEAGIDLIGLQQPVASDLRNIFAALSIAVELERIGDYAVSITKTTLQTAGRSLAADVPEIGQMAEAARGMLRQALEAYAATDGAAARALIAQDHAITRLNERAHRVLVDLMVEQREAVDQGSRLLRICHNLDRVADRVINICERVEYQVSGRLPEVEPVAI